jgi:hypothetical protein
MEFLVAFKKVKESGEFKKISKEIPDIYLSYALKIIEETNEQPWQLGFYHKEADKIITFVMESKISVQKEEEIFKKPEMQVRQIDTKMVKLPFSKILEKNKQFQKEKYPKQTVTKTIAILQNLEEYGNVWNLTNLTNAFNTLNIKINPDSGKVVAHEIDSLMGLIKK